ncbi:hypothetical protein QWY77_11745 [Thalassotalea ponticola]|uniref:hypothetical protein n=1 Tax=Thalassotalea ponticola TaxID=1523392 RepID=UPI0025B43A2D|nr:hypothetical protein [Thalassotalea ponticola]MDN3653415.1 hypothetical protein [Thalassotalea ponticola]
MAYTIYFSVLIFLQFLAPKLAVKIKNRFRELGVDMETSVYISMLNTSGFWHEAKDLNSSRNDALIAKYLWIYKSWWVLFIVGMVGLFFGVGY